MNALTLEAVGYLGTLASIYVSISKTMIPLRAAAVVANILLAIYFYAKGLYPQCALNFALLPINFYRLRQMQSIIASIKRASRADFDFEWLRPFMKPRKIHDGTMIYFKDDIATEAFVIVRGSIRIPEKNVVLDAGVLLGEMGIFTDENRRTASAEAIGEVDLLVLAYSDLLQLSAQNPTFGFYLMRLMVRRMQHNVEFAANDPSKKPSTT